MVFSPEMVTDMRRLFFIVFVFVSLTASAQNVSIDPIMRLCGVTTPEELDSYEVERLSDYQQTPLQVNRSSLSDLQKSGLFTPFQAASIMDYRSRHGDILSFVELAALDGFGQETVEILRSFVALESHTLPGQRRTAHKRLKQDLSLRGGGRADDGLEYMGGLKYRVEYGGLGLSLSGSRSYGDASYVSGNLSWNHRLGKIIVGDYNARFGQGLCLWNSSVIGGLTSPSAFMRKPSGLSATYSFTGSSAMTGIAADMEVGRWRTSFLLNMPDLKERPVRMLVPALNISWFGRYGHASLTHSMTFSDCTADFRIPQMRTAADASLCIGGINLFGEVAYDWVCRSAAAVCGTDFRASEDLRLAALVKYFPPSGYSNEYGAAVSGQYSAGRWIRIKGREGFGSSVRRSKGIFSMEMSYFPKSKSKDGGKSVQMKMHTEWDFMLTDFLLLKCRLTERLRTWGEKSRTDVRLEARYMSEHIHAAMRLNALKCVGVGLLGYAEGGYIGKKLSSYMRVGVFRIDDWDDRIYVYERDAPGSFNVPAYYGRGLWVACNLSWRLASWCRSYLRTSYMDYPFMPAEKRKPGRAELKIQFVFRL